MKIILLDDIKGVGRKHEIKEVAEGYARNYLFARKRAIPADKKGLAGLREHEKATQHEISELRALAQKSEGDTLSFVLKVDAAGNPFGGVNKDMIQKALYARGISPRERIKVELAKPIRTFGKTKVRILLPRGITATIIVSVLPTRV